FGGAHEGSVSGMLIVPKGWTSGCMPMGAVVVSDRIAQHFESRMLPLGSTYAAHPLACAAAAACLDEYERLQLIPNARRMGDLLFRQLRELAKRHPCVGDVRGKGLLACLDLVTDRKTKAPLVGPNMDSPIPMQIRRKGWDEGIHLRPRGTLIMP